MPNVPGKYTSAVQEGEAGSRVSQSVAAPVTAPLNAFGHLRDWWSRTSAVSHVIAAILAAGASAATIWVSVKPEPAVKFTPLVWAPSDCARSEPLVGLGSCAELRALPWLRAQILHLRAAKVPGYVDLHGQIELRTAAHQGQPHWILFLSADGAKGWNLGVGYNAKTGAKDGVLRLYHAGAPAAPGAKIDADGQWWIQDERLEWRRVSE